MGIYHVCLELYPPGGGNYYGGPAHLFFQDLLFCEEHANMLGWRDLIYPEALSGQFEQFGHPAPDFNRTRVRLLAAQGVETV